MKKMMAVLFCCRRDEHAHHTFRSARRASSQIRIGRRMSAFGGKAGYPGEPLLRPNLRVTGLNAKYDSHESDLGAQ
jgi:hypothetical protein